ALGAPTKCNPLTRRLTVATAPSFFFAPSRESDRRTHSSRGRTLRGPSSSSCLRVKKSGGAILRASDHGSAPKHLPTRAREPYGRYDDRLRSSRTLLISAWRLRSMR